MTKPFLIYRENTTSKSTNSKSSTVVTCNETTADRSVRQNKHNSLEIQKILPEVRTEKHQSVTTPLVWLFNTD